MLVFLPLMLSAQNEHDRVVPLQSWQSPLYWHANQAEKVASGKPVPQLQFSPNAVSPDALTFVAITPCRLVDTRGAAAGFDGAAPFNGPSIAAAGTLTIPVQSSSEASTNTMPAPCGAIPSIAEAYSFNVTLVPVTAGGVNYVTLWPAGASQPIVSSLNDVQGGIVANAAIVPAGAPNGGISVYNQGPATIDIVIDMNGYFAAPTDLSYNTAIGAGALASNSGGSFNTASGAYSLASNTTGNFNTASGFNVLAANTTGTANTATGPYALSTNTSGNSNTAYGFDALQFSTTASNNTASGYYALNANTTGSDSTAIGFQALVSNTTGSSNIAFGEDTLANNTTGSTNIAIGNDAGALAPAANGNSIYIGTQGTASDVSGTIQIGDPSTATSFFVAGVYGVTTLVNPVDVVIDANGQLGTRTPPVDRPAPPMLLNELQRQVRALEGRLAALEASLPTRRPDR